MEESLGFIAQCDYSVVPDCLVGTQAAAAAEWLNYSR